MKGFDRFMATMGGMFLVAFLTILIWGWDALAFWFSDIGIICLFLIGLFSFIMASKAPD